MSFLVGKNEQVSNVNDKTAGLHGMLLDYLGQGGSLDRLFPSIDPNKQNLQPFLDMFTQQNARTFGQAKESAGNLTGSSLGNILGSEAGRAATEQGGWLNNFMEQRRQNDANRFAQVLLGGLGSPAGQVSNMYQPGLLDYAGQAASGLASGGAFNFLFPGSEGWHWGEDQVTIPIRPGPFSFLAQFGQAGGEAFDAAHKEETKLKKEAQDRLNMMITLRSQGLIKPDAFHSAEAMQIYKRLGITPVSDQPNAQDLINFTKTQFGNTPSPENKVQIPNSILQGAGSALMPAAVIPAQGPDAVSDARRMVAGLPTRSALGIEALRAQRLAEGGPGANVVAGAPSNEVAGAQEQAAIAQGSLEQGKLYRSEADQFVSQALAGADPRSFGGPQGGPAKAAEDAYRLYLADAAANKRAPMPEEVARRYFAGAVQDRIDYLKNQEIAAMRANAYAQNGQIPELAYLDRQIDNVNNELGRLDTIAKNAASKFAGIPVESARQNPVFATDVAEYEAAIQQAETVRARQRELSSEYTARYSKHFPSVGGAQNPLEDRRRDWDAKMHKLRSKGVAAAQYNDILGPRP